MQNTLSQGYAFLAYLYAGVVLSLVYDSLHLVDVLCDRRAVTHALDAIFVLVFTVVTYLAIALSDDGALRLYGFLTMTGGAALLHATIGRTICKRIVKRRR